MLLNIDKQVESCADRALMQDKVDLDLEVLPAQPRRSLRCTVPIAEFFLKEFVLALILTPASPGIKPV